MGVALRTYVHNYYSKVVAMRARSLDIRGKTLMSFGQRKNGPLRLQMQIPWTSLSSPF